MGSIEALVLFVEKLVLFVQQGINTAALQHYYSIPVLLLHAPQRRKTPNILKGVVITHSQMRTSPSAPCTMLLQSFPLRSRTGQRRMGSRTTYVREKLTKAIKNTRTPHSKMQPAHKVHRGRTASETQCSYVPITPRRLRDVTLCQNSDKSFSRFTKYVHHLVARKSRKSNYRIVMGLPRVTIFPVESFLV